MRPIHVATRRIGPRRLRCNPQLPFALINRFNVAPTQDVPIVRLAPAGQRELSLVRWGFIPYWAHGLPKTQPINARDDHLLTSRLFRPAFERRRCLVLADGFYEWKGAKPPKTPIFFRLKSDTPFAFAGLWERWKPGHEAEPIDTCLHITTAPNDLVAPVHDRMPAILHPNDHEQWLDPNVSADQAAKLLRPFAPDLMEAYEVSTSVNRVANDDPALVEPAASLWT